MKILFSVGGCLRQNSSANLCHSAYIRGCIENGHTVDVISLSDRDCQIDKSISLPHARNWYYYNGAVYSHLASLSSKHRVSDSPTNKSVDIAKPSMKSRLIKVLKDKVVSLYGVYGLEKGWVRNARRFSSNEVYDLVISLATPPASHLLIRQLIHAGRIKTKYWCQIWEDPWASELYVDKKLSKKRVAERKIVACADKVLYVSPLTLEYQKKLYPESAGKMDWVPLPYYYKEEGEKREGIGIKRNPLLGYYGDYDPKIRNLEPFYRAVRDLNLQANIFGNPAGLFQSTEKIHVSPRVSLQTLSLAEKETDILVFLCNLKGGQIPGKIYQYSATSKPILFILDGTEAEKEALKKYFRVFDRYVFCENTEEAIQEAITKMIDHKQDDTRIINRVVEDFSPANIAKEIIDCCCRND
ncbi:hypothetical protein [Bittarella massiliensis (ex Durand et al. 2017)]|uniref:hypothetical protein n=1 Tax=Bittarella massiliensis (ex Durand et al. 2017) TaxID=1720313 RepID=UPI0012B5583A|nr:hypothetical protein [Bittarella massiliensis (ex Durand et al. 2017)]